MTDAREQLSTLTVILHWLIGLTMIGMVFFGMWIADLHPAATDTVARAEKSAYVALHKSIGMIALVFILWRVVRRLAIGLPKPVGVYQFWEHALAKATHYALLFATIALPVTGILNSIGNMRVISVFGVPVIPQLLAEKNVQLASFGKISHDILGKVLLALIALHIIGALKHHFLDKDGTLRRIAGARVEPRTTA
jgi:cytochrome b561